MRGNPTTVRWGDRRDITVPSPGTAAESQFIDLDLGEPQELVLTLSATVVPPMAGLSVTWKVYWGGGAAMQIEPLTLPVQDEAAPNPVTLRRSASKIRVTAVVANSIAGLPRGVVLSAFVGPVFGGLAR